MAERSSIYQVSQIGVETTPGTAVPANKKLNSFMISMGPKVETKTYAPAGSKYDTITTLNKEWASGKLSGPMAYSEILYVLSGMYSIGAGSQIGTTGAYTYNTSANTFGADTYNTFTIEKGDGTYCEQFVGTFFTGWGYKGDRSSVEISGDLLGKKMTTGFTQTANPTAIEQTPEFPSQVTVAFDTTSAGLGTTKLTRLLNYEFSHSGAKQPLWVVDASQGSYVAVVETKPKVEFKVQVEADTQGLAQMTTLRNVGFVYVQVQAIGATISTSPAAAYTFTHQMACHITDVTEFEDKDGVYAIGYTLSPQYDATWGTGGKAQTFTSIAKIAAL